MPSHGQFDFITGATATYTAADKLTQLIEADVEIVEWGFIQTTAGVWTTLPMTAKLELRDAGGANPVITGKTFTLGGSPAIGSRLYVRPVTPIQVGPGRLVAVAVVQVGTATAGAGAPFLVLRRKSFHPDRINQTNDINATAP